MSNLFSALNEDFKVYSDIQSGMLQKILGPFLTLGYYVVLIYRIRSELMRLGRPGRLIATVIGFLSNILSGCYISAKAKIGPGLYLPHAIGIVIGDGVTLGTHVTVYQSVTIGSRAKGANAYPTIANDVIIFPSSIIIGRIDIGEGAIIGAGSVVLSNVPAHSVAVGNPSRILPAR